MTADLCPVCGRTGSCCQARDDLRADVDWLSEAANEIEQLSRYREVVNTALEQMRRGAYVSAASTLESVEDER